ncbi:hypothetical protein V500_10477 [Pseudogymnoascus sp. VKM F-4518 (FW-2643)]|nr:hypothetical protein V500_10477 [Pseudogymnoascus sp. VKM F-4518 (FW-2643)]
MLFTTRAVTDNTDARAAGEAGATDFLGWGKFEAAWAYLGEKAAPLRWWTPRSVSGAAGTKGERRPLLGQRGLVGGDDADEAGEGEVDDDSAESRDLRRRRRGRELPPRLRNALRHLPFLRDPTPLGATLSPAAPRASSLLHLDLRPPAHQRDSSSDGKNKLRAEVNAEVIAGEVL